MGSVSKERPYVPTIERHMLRYQLFQEIRQRGRYKNDILASLRPLWKKSMAEVGWGGWAKSVPELRALARPSERPNLVAYVSAVQRYTTDTLRITCHGQPVMWASAFVHVDVEPQSGADGLTVYDPSEPPPAKASAFTPVFGGLRMFVNPSVARFGVNDDLSTWESVHAAEFMRFDEWDDFERDAIVALKVCIADMRAEFKSLYPKRRPSGGGWRAKALEDLAAHLMRGDTPPPNTTERTHLVRLAKELGVDFPRDRFSPRS